MSQLVSEHVNHDWPRQTEESDQPKNCAQGKKPKFLTSPEALRYSRACKYSKKCLSQNYADRQQKNPKNKLYPARRY